MLENFEWVQFVSIKIIPHKFLLALIYHIHAKLLHAFEWMDNTDIGKTNYSGDNTRDVYVNSNALQEHYQYDIKTPNIIILAIKSCIQRFKIYPHLLQCIGYLNQNCQVFHLLLIFPMPSSSASLLSLPFFCFFPSLL